MKSKSCHSSALPLLTAAVGLIAVFASSWAGAASLEIELSEAGQLVGVSNVSMIEYCPERDLLFLLDGSDVRIVRGTTGEVIENHTATESFTDMDLTSDGRYLFVADYGGERMGYGTPLSPHYVHRYDLQQGVWLIAQAPKIAWKIEAVAADRVLLQEHDQHVDMTLNSFGSTMTELSRIRADYYGDLEYDPDTKRAYHGSSGSSSREIHVRTVVGDTLISNGDTGVYGTAQNGGGTSVLSTDGFYFYYGALQVEAGNVSNNLRTFPERIYAASPFIAFGQENYYAAASGALLDSWDFTCGALGVSEDGKHVWAHDTGSGTLHHYTISGSDEKLLLYLEVDGPRAVGFTNEAQFVATAFYKDGSEEDVTASCTWSIDNAGFGSIDTAGLVTTVARPGAFSVEAAYTEAGRTLTVSRSIECIEGYGIRGVKEVEAFSLGTDVSQIEYAPLYDLLFLRQGALVLVVDAVSREVLSSQSATNTFSDMDLTHDGRYLFVADYGGERTGYGTPLAPHYVHRYDALDGVWDVAEAPKIAWKIEAVASDRVLLQEQDQHVDMTLNSFGSTMTELSRIRADYYGDLEYDSEAKRAYHGSSGSSSREIHVRTVEGDTLVNSGNTGGYGTAQNGGGSSVLSTDGSYFYYGSLQVDAMNIRSNLHTMAERIYAAAPHVAFGQNRYYDAETGGELSGLGYSTTTYGLSEDGCHLWAFESSDDFLHHYEVDWKLDRIMLQLPHLVREVDGELVGACQVQVPAALSVDTVFTLRCSAPDSITIPDSVTISAGSSNAGFNVTIIDFDVLNGSRDVVIEAVADGFYSGRSRMGMLYDEATHLFVDMPDGADEGDGLLSQAGSVTVQTPPSSNMAVNLYADDPLAIEVPETITIPAGETNVTFDITILDDNLLDGPQEVTVLTVTEYEGYSSGLAKILIRDNETATLSLSLPQTTYEGAGSISGALSVDRAPVNNTAVELISSNENEIESRSVIIPAGQTLLSITLPVNDDNMIDGPQNVDITAVVQNWSNGVSSIVVNDNETRDLALELPSAVSEGGGVLLNAAVVRISGTLTNDLLITLQSDNQTALTAPASVTIPAGSTSIAFDLTAINDAVLDGDQSAQLTASAIGFTAAAGAVTVADDEGQIHGSKWWDEDGDGVWSTNEIGLENWKIYQDLNTNGQWDSGEPFDLTDTTGSYSMIVEPGEYVIGEEDKPFWFQSSANSSGSGELTYEQVVKDGVEGVDGLYYANSVTLSPDGHHVYVTATYDNSLTVFGRDSQSGQLSFIQVLKHGVGGIDGLLYASSVTLSPDGSYAYVTTSSSVAVFSRDLQSGQLSFEQVLKDGVDGVDGLQGASSVTISPDGKHAYVAASTDSSVAVFSRDPLSGQLSFVQVLKDRVGGIEDLSGASHITLSPDGNHAYVASTTDDSVSVFSRNTLSGQLSLIQVLKDGAGGVDGLNGAINITLSPDGKHVYVAGYHDRTISVFSRDSLSGQLSFTQVLRDNVAGVDGLYYANSVAVSSDGLHAYVTAQRDHTVAVFSRDVPSGQLSFLQVLKDGVGGIDGLDGARSVTVSPDDRHVYVASLYDDSVAAFSRDSGVVGAQGVVVAPQQVVENVDFGNATTGLVLNIVLPEESSEGAGVVAGQVTLSVAPLSDLVVNLAASDISEVAITNRLIIPAGQTNIPFSVNILDDPLLDGSNPVAIDAYAISYTRDSHVLTVHDNESASLSLSLPQTSFEGAGTVSGAISVSAAPGRDVMVSLISNNPNEIRSTNVVIQAGQTIAFLDLAIEDDDILDGLQTATITAYVHNWSGDSASIFVIDNEDIKLFLQMPAAMTEGDGVITNGGTVSILATAVSDIHVLLTCSDATELDMPAYVTIPAGMNQAVFDVAVIDDADLDGTTAVSVLAEAPGYIPDSANISILDNDPHHLFVEDLSEDPALSEPVPIAVSARTVDGNIVDAFSDTVSLTANGDRGAISITPSVLTNVVDGVASGTVSFGHIGNDVTLVASGGGMTATSTVFNVLSPQIVISSNSLTNTLVVAGETATRTMVISNTGNADLVFEIRGTEESPLSPPLFADGFEDGNYDGWTEGSGSVSREVTSAMSAEGLYSVSIDGGSSHYEGISHSLDAIQPKKIEFYVRSDNVNSASGYFTVGNDQRDIIAFYMSSGYMRLNGSSSMYRCYSDLWYKVTFLLDWTVRRFDVLVDDELVRGNVGFRYSTVESLTRINLYNWHNAKAWWDGIALYSEVDHEADPPDPSWLSTDPISGIIPPGSNITAAVIFDGAGMVAGTYSNTLLRVICNDVVSPSNDVPTSMYVIPPAPIMDAEPEMTYGSSNTVLWSAVDGPVTYLVEVATDTVSAALQQSAWLDTTNHTFAPLATDQMYYYRARASVESDIGTLEGPWSGWIWSTQLPALVDGDDDGIPDWWEDLHFGGTGVAGHTTDSDDDGQSDHDEYVAGMNPTNPASCFMINDASVPTNGPFAIYWDAVTGRVYSVHWAESLTNAFTPMATNIVYPQGSYTDEVHQAESGGFYKIEVELQ